MCTFFFFGRLYINWVTFILSRKFFLMKSCQWFISCNKNEGWCHCYFIFSLKIMKQKIISVSTDLGITKANKKWCKSSFLPLGYFVAFLLKRSKQLNKRASSKMKHKNAFLVRTLNEPKCNNKNTWNKLTHIYNSYSEIFSSICDWDLISFHIYSVAFIFICW